MNIIMVATAALTAWPCTMRVNPPTHYRLLCASIPRRLQLPLASATPCSRISLTSLTLCCHASSPTRYRPSLTGQTFINRHRLLHVANLADSRHTLSHSGSCCCWSHQLFHRNTGCNPQDVVDAFPWVPRRAVAGGWMLRGWTCTLHSTAANNIYLRVQVMACWCIGHHVQLCWPRQVFELPRRHHFVTRLITLN